MIAYLIRRLISMITTVWGIATIVFLLLFFIPGDPVRMMLGAHGDEETRARITRELELDQPLTVQYAGFITRLLHFDMGRSYRQNRPVSEIILERFPATLTLAAAALLLSMILGISAGMIAALRQNKFTDFLVMIGSLVGISTPVFWLGLILILVFSSRQFNGDPVVFGILPVSGYGEPGWDRLRHLLLPAASLSAIGMGYIARMTRSSVLEVIRQDYIRTAAAKGVSRVRIMLKHVFRNAMIPVITIIGLDFAALLGGAVATETVFAWPGLGKVVVDAIRQLDAPIVEGGVMMFAFIFVMTNIIVDICYMLVDPRIRLE